MGFLMQYDLFEIAQRPHLNKTRTITYKIIFTLFLSTNVGSN